MRSLLSKWKASLGLGCCAGRKARRRSGAGLLPKAEVAGRLPNCAASGLLLWAAKHTAGRLLLRLGRSKSKPAGWLRLRGAKGKRTTGGLLLLLLLLLLRRCPSEAAKPAERLLRWLGGSKIEASGWLLLLGGLHSSECARGLLHQRRAAKAKPSCGLRLLLERSRAAACWLPKRRRRLLRLLGEGCKACGLHLPKANGRAAAAAAAKGWGLPERSRACRSARPSHQGPRHCVTQAAGLGAARARPTLKQAGPRRPASCIDSATGDVGA